MRFLLMLQVQDESNARQRLNIAVAHDQVRDGIYIVQTPLRCDGNVSCRVKDIALQLGRTRCYIPHEFSISPCLPATSLLKVANLFLASSDVATVSSKRFSWDISRTCIDRQRDMGTIPCTYHASRPPETLQAALQLLEKRLQSDGVLTVPNQQQT